MWAGIGFLDFHLNWIEGGISPLSSPEFGTGPQGEGLPAFPWCWAPALPRQRPRTPPRLLSAASPSRHLPSQASRWRGLRTPGRARASLRGSCLARPQRTLGEGGQGEVRVVPFALVTGSGLAPLGCAPKKEEGDPRGGSWGLVRARGGRTVRGALAGGRRSVSRCDPHRGPGWSGGRGLGPAGRGRASAPRQGAGTPRTLPGAGLVARRRREGPPSVPGEPAPLSQLLPLAPTAGLASGGGRQAPLRVSSDISSGWEGSRCTPEPGQRAGMIKEPGPSQQLIRTGGLGDGTGMQTGCGRDKGAALAERPSGPS